MKNQLLEDFGDSQSGMQEPKLLRARAVPSRTAPPPPPVIAAAPEVPADATQPRQRAGVWRSRAAEPLQGPSAHPSPPAPPEPLHAPQSPQASEPLRAEPRLAPEFGSFSSREPDWAIPLPHDDTSRTEGWGRKVLGWTAGLGAVLALAATAAWMVRETRVESTLAVVAGHTPASIVRASPAAAVTAPVAAPAPEPEAPPPLRLLPPEPAVPEAAPVPAPVPAPAVETPPPVKRAAVNAARERRTADVKPIKRSRPVAGKPARVQAGKPAPRPARARTLARAVPLPPPAPPAPPVPAGPPPVPAADSPLAETLRLCRAAGYHATACIKRGCEATRFGLACRG